MKYDVIIVGAGPAGIFTAIEMIQKKSQKKILIIEKGSPIEKRKCCLLYTSSWKFWRKPPSCFGVEAVWSRCV